jgi:hypothetical protein
VARPDEDRLVDLDVQEESAAVRCGVTAALVRDGRKPRALWVSTFDRVVASGRLNRERETHLPAVHGGAVDLCALSSGGRSRAHQRGGIATATGRTSVGAWIL